MFQDTALNTFQAINAPKKPLSLLSVAEREQVLVNVAETIKQHLATTQTAQEQTKPSS
jgi:hypothetical protein